MWFSYANITAAKGNLGTAILNGILSSLEDAQDEHKAPAASDRVPSSEGIPPRIPTKFIACCTRNASSQRIQKSLERFSDNLDVVDVIVNGNVHAAKKAEVILLGCKPYHLKTVLTESGMRQALRGKLLISIWSNGPTN